MKRRLTIEDLADQIAELSKTMIRGFRLFDGKLSAVHISLVSLREELKTDIENLAIMTAQGFEKTATKEELITGLHSLRTELKSDMKELRQDLTQTIFTEVGRIDRRIDQITHKPKWLK